jgi:hypothetical protein
MGTQGFYNPVADEFIEPSLTGISYSFTPDGFYEEAYYRAIANRMSRRASVRGEITDDNSYASQLPASYHAIPARDIHRKCGQLIEHEPFWC